MGREYINEWRKQRSKEEEELQRLKEKQAKRKEIRAEQEKKLAQQKREEEERFRREEAEKKAREADDKRKRLEEAERKRQMMMQAQSKSNSGNAGNEGGKRLVGGMGNLADARKEMTKTKEQLEEEKRISLSIRIKPLDLDGLYQADLKNKATELWQTIVRLETDKYDLQERQKRQDYDLRELKERQRQQNKQKAIKLGLDPEALTGKYPPKIRMYSKYERRTDTRTYDDRRKLYEGGWDVLYAELLEKSWKEKMDEWTEDPKPSFPSGLVRDLARKLENQSLLMMRMRLLEMLLLVLKRRKGKKKKRRRKNKYFSLLEHFSSYKLKPLIVHNKLCNSQCK